MIVTASSFALSQGEKDVSLPHASHLRPASLFARLSTMLCLGLEPLASPGVADIAKELASGSMPGRPSRPKVSSQVFSLSQHRTSTSRGRIFARTMSWLKSGRRVTSETHASLALVTSSVTLTESSVWSQDQSLIGTVFRGASFVLSAFPLALPTVSAPDRSIWPRSSSGFPHP